MAFRGGNHQYTVHPILILLRVVLGYVCSRGQTRVLHLFVNAQSLVVVRDNSAVPHLHLRLIQICSTIKRCNKLIQLTMFHLKILNSVCELLARGQRGAAGRRAVVFQETRIKFAIRCVLSIVRSLLG